MSDLNNHTDQELVILLREGHQEAFDAIYRRYWKRLFDEAGRRVGQSGYAEEIVQEVFIDVWLHRESRTIDHLLPYLLSAVRYQVFSLYKRQQRLPSFEEPLESIGISSDKADSSIFLRELLNGIDKWLALQPEKRREIFRLRYLEQLSTKEIADELEISQKTVQNQLLNGQDSLRTAVLKLFTIAAVFLTNNA